MIQRILASIVLCTISGCGPVMFPMVNRLDPDQQRQFDQMWDNMLTPVNRTDRQTLLDCIVLFGMQTNGVDEFHSQSVKYTHAGRVEMTIDFDREKPNKDRFKIRVIRHGWTIRREQYSSDEVTKSVQGLFGVQIQKSLARPLETSEPAPERTNGPAPSGATDAEMKKEQEEVQRRIERIVAATQPVK